MGHVVAWFYGLTGRIYGWFHDEQRRQAVQAGHSTSGNLRGVQWGSESSVSHDRDSEGGTDPSTERVES